MGYNKPNRLTFQDTIYFRVKSTARVDIKKLYTIMHNWFVEEEYCLDEGKFPEMYMYERREPDSKYIYILWRFNKQPFGDDFHNRTVDIEFKIPSVSNTEVQHNGQKFKIQTGIVEIKTWWYLEYDVNEKWRNHWFLKHFLDVYVNKIFKKDFEKHRIELFRDAKSLQAALKEYFNLVSFDTGTPTLKRVMNVEDTS